MTEFLPMDKKADLMKALESGDKNAIKNVINELDRLESIIKGYEVAMSQITKALDSTTFKKPSI